VPVRYHDQRGQAPCSCGGTYDHVFGVASDYKKKKAPRPLPADFPVRFKKCADRIAAAKLPEAVADAMEKATADKGRRDKRHKFFMESLGLESAR